VLGCWHLHLFLPGLPAVVGVVSLQLHQQVGGKGGEAGALDGLRGRGGGGRGDRWKESGRSVGLVSQCGARGECGWTAGTSKRDLRSRHQHN
jgi:hypothetical protein